MNKIMISGALLFLCALAGAQAPAAPERGRSVADGRSKTEAEIKTLRAVAKPMLELKRKHGAAMSALKRAQAAERKQLIGRLSSASREERNKAMSGLNKKHRAAAQKLREANKAEMDKFIKKDPEAERSYKELLYSGVRVAEPAATPVEPGKTGK
ncbi:MAG: hypothetical protein A2049_11145 [Elusimicrobia bacterium GWA2_62_23]|nr:MAG: hypothetical protein A2049_11145 [Elusimicrobia bacterium GWA2_62_23]